MSHYSFLINFDAFPTHYYNFLMFWIWPGGVVRPHPPPDSAYKSLGSVFAPKDSPPGRETKKKQACSVQVNPVQPTPGFQAVKSSRSVQNMAERSMSVSESERTRGLSSRTPHRTAGYGGAGQPSRGPHRYFFFNFFNLKKVTMYNFYIYKLSTNYYKIKAKCFKHTFNKCLMSDE